MKNLLLKDLSSRLPYGILCDIGTGLPERLIGISVDYTGGHLFQFLENREVYLSEVKPYLLPLSEMTEAQQEELLDICGIYIRNNKVVILEDGTTIEDVQKGLEYLDKNFFDYRGLIEQGLAHNAKYLGIYA